MKKLLISSLLLLSNIGVIKAQYKYAVFEDPYLNSFGVDTLYVEYERASKNEYIHIEYYNEDSSSHRFTPLFYLKYNAALKRPKVLPDLSPKTMLYKINGGVVVDSILYYEYIPFNDFYDPRAFYQGKKFWISKKSIVCRYTSMKKGGMYSTIIGRQENSEFLYYEVFGLPKDTTSKTIKLDFKKLGLVDWDKAWKAETKFPTLSDTVYVPKSFEIYLSAENFYGFHFKLFPKLHLMKAKIVYNGGKPIVYFNEHIPQGSFYKKQNISISISGGCEDFVSCWDSLRKSLYKNKKVRCYFMNDNITIKEQFHLFYDNKIVGDCFKNTNESGKELHKTNKITYPYVDFKVDKLEEGVNTFRVYVGTVDCKFAEFELPIYKNFPVIKLHYIPKGVFGKEKPHLFAEYTN